MLGLVLAIGAYAGWYRLSGEGRLPAETVTAIPERLAPLAEQALQSPSGKRANRSATIGRVSGTAVARVALGGSATSETPPSPAPPVAAISPTSAAGGPGAVPPGRWSGGGSSDGGAPARRTPCSGRQPSCPACQCCRLGAGEGPSRHRPAEPDDEGGRDPAGTAQVRSAADRRQCGRNRNPAGRRGDPQPGRVRRRSAGLAAGPGPDQGGPADWCHSATTCLDTPPPVADRRRAPHNKVWSREADLRVVTRALRGRSSA